nr:hypothetical protein [Tanacetum cinerariifolium]
MKLIERVEMAMIAMILEVAEGQSALLRRDQEAEDQNVKPEGQGNGRCELHTTLLGISTDGSVMASKPKIMQETIEIANDLMDQKVRAYAERQDKNKRKFNNNNQTQQQPPKKQSVAIAYIVGSGERREYVGTLPLCNRYKLHHNESCTVKYGNCKKVGHMTCDFKNPAAVKNQITLTCFKCGNQGHYKSDCPELKNQNHRNKNGGTEARGMVYALGGGETDQDLDDMEDDINSQTLFPLGILIVLPLKFMFEFPNQDMKEEFPGWFETQIRQRYIDKDLSISDELFALACGPISTPILVNSCVVNGVRFIVHSRDKHRIIQNNGICSPDEKDGEMYYGQLEEILEFLYTSFKVVLFLVKCLKDLNSVTLNIDGQSTDVEAPPDIIDVDEDGDFIDDEDGVPHNLADYNDEFLANDDDADTWEAENPTGEAVQPTDSVAQNQEGHRTACGQGLRRQQVILKEKHRFLDPIGRVMWQASNPDLLRTSSKHSGIRRLTICLILSTLPERFKMLKTRQRARSSASRDPDHLLSFKISRWRASRPEEMIWLRDIGANTPMGVPYTEDQIMAMVRKGKKCAHILGVGRVLEGQGRDAISINESWGAYTYTGVVEVKEDNKRLRKELDMLRTVVRSDDWMSQLPA